MTEGEYFREQLITFIENHKEDFISDYEYLIEILKDKNRRIPIRGIKESMRGCDQSKYSDAEKEMLDEAMYRYGQTKINIETLPGGKLPTGKVKPVDGTLEMMNNTTAPDVSKKLESLRRSKK